MSIKAHTTLQKVVVFATEQPMASTADAELRQIFPEADVTIIGPAKAAELLSASAEKPVNWSGAIDWLRQEQFDAAVILTAPGQSPYTLGYLCYLAGIPIRLGHSHEFGGQVLSHCSPPPDAVDCGHLLELLL